MDFLNDTFYLCRLLEPGTHTIDGVLAFTLAFQNAFCYHVWENTW